MSTHTRQMAVRWMVGLAVGLTGFAVWAEETAVSPEVNRALRLLTASDSFSKKAGLLEILLDS